jgi:hypothetical protein
MIPSRALVRSVALAVLLVLVAGESSAAGEKY